MANWGEWSGRPFMATEWYAKGMDSGMANITGAGWTMTVQKDRGRFDQNYTLSLVKEPGCVGRHRFKYMANDPTNAKVDPSNLDSNMGIVSNLYRSYPDLLDMMLALNFNVYALRDFLGVASSFARPKNGAVPSSMKNGGNDSFRRTCRGAPQDLPDWTHSWFNRTRLNCSGVSVSVTK